MRTHIAVALALLGAALSSSAPAQTPPTGDRPATVGGAPMDPAKTIVANAAGAPDLTTLVAAIRAARLDGTLSGPGPFTLFAPTNAAFAALPAGALEALSKPESRPRLTALLTYHVVPGTMSAADLAARVAAGRGRATLTTVQGKPLTVTDAGGRLRIEDARGGRANVTVPDLNQSNGVLHVIDAVLMPL